MSRILVTGATDGIGKETAFELARRGAEVLVHGRNEKKTLATIEELKKRSKLDVFRPVFGDLSSLAEVRALAKQIEPLDIDVLLHNAGLYAKRREVTVDGFELTFAVNHLAPFVLTHLLLPKLRQRPAPRVVLVASMVHSSGEIDFENLQLTRGFDGYTAYANSKLMNVVFGYELARRLEGTKVTVNSLHPGVISTKLLHGGFGAGGAPLAEGAKTSVKLAVDPELEGVTGKYFSNQRETPSSRASHDRETQRRLYEVSCELGGVQPI
jgi:NAD(P)-dependent dehydrogenase (short-subunit alcohol dehydrogenase family)